LPVAFPAVIGVARPGANITGFSNFDAQMTVGSKWGLTVKEIDQRIERVALVFHPQTAPFAQLFVRSIEATQRLSSVTLAAMSVHNAAELERAITDFASTPNGGLWRLTR
jgi:putative ABC transport system substrate-binding protein